MLRFLALPGLVLVAGGGWLREREEATQEA